jgi:hypothetical protein
MSVGKVSPCMELLEDADVHALAPFASPLIQGKNVPVYAIKRTQEGDISYEVYFYRYVPERPSWKVIDIYKPGVAHVKQSLAHWQPNIKHSAEYAKNTHTILSLDVNYNGDIKTNTNYYYSIHTCNNKIMRCDYEAFLYKGGYTFCCVEEDDKGVCEVVNLYGHIDDIISSEEQQFIPFLQELREPEVEVFYGKKLKKNCYSLYYEGMSYPTFLCFLGLLNYPDTTVHRIQRLYGSIMPVFHVSYDIDLVSSKVIKSAIFGILSPCEHMQPGHKTS